MSHKFSGQVFSGLNLWTCKKSKLSISNPYPDAYNSVEHLRPSIFTKIVNSLKALTQQTFVGLQDVLKTLSRHIFKTSSRCLQDVFKTCLQDVFKTSWRKTKCLLEISVSKKSKSVPDKFISHTSISDKLR